MILYLVKGYLDLAATTLADAQALLTALANPALASNQAIIDKVTGKLETLVQSDSGEPLTISSIDDAAGSYSAWVTDAQTTLAVGLGLPNTSTLDTYASTTSFSITANTRTGTLALNSRELSNGLLRGGLRLQIRTTNSAGAAETRALLRINVVPGVLESPVGDRDVDYTSYVEVAALATAAAASAAAATTAETNAETAETNAETAQAAAALSAAAALVSENAASASASTATTQAGTATTQAGTATTQAGIATTQAGLAAAAKTAAETAETNAETAETNAETAEAAAAISAAAALVSEAAALVSKNAAAASAATASAVSGSGNGTFSAAALTGVNSITASASTALTLTGGSTGASLVLGQGASGVITLTPTAGYVSLANAKYLRLPYDGTKRWDIGADFFSTAGELLFQYNGVTQASFKPTGNLLIGTTTDAASLAGGLVVNGSGAGAAASSTTTGALRVTGGVGVSGAGYFGGDITMTRGASGGYFSILTSGTTAEQAVLFTDSGGASGAVIYTHSTDTMVLNAGGATRLSLNSTAATFAGAVTVNGQLIAKGTATNDNAATGYIGEYVSSSVASSVAITLTTSTPANVTSISLTAGDWDVDGTIGFIPSGSPTINALAASASSTTATHGAESDLIVFPTTATGYPRASLPRTRFTLSATTTVYLISEAIWTGGTSVKGFGRITARRVR